MMTYPLIYMLIWTIPTTIRIYQATTGKAAPFGIGTVDKASPLVLFNGSTNPDKYSVLYRHPGFRRCNRVRVQ